MSNKILLNTVVIKVPSEFISVNAKGQIKIAPPLTKKGALAKKGGKAAINIIPSNTDKVEIENSGDYQSYTPKAKKVYTDAQIKRRKENKELVKAHHAKAAADAGETVHERMARLRSMRKSHKKKVEMNHKLNLNRTSQNKKIKNSKYLE